MTTPAAIIPSLPNLVGTELIDGWKIVRELPRANDSQNSEKTGGNFSLSCVAEKEVKGRPNEVAFVKVFDFTKANAVTGNFMTAASLLNSSFKAEVDILDKCMKEGLDRVIRKRTSGEIAAIPGITNYPAPYIILEHADADLRQVVNNAKYDIAYKLKVLHDVAVGINQIHSKDISHYDLKPSNVLVLDNVGEGSKIADFGLSIDHKEAGPLARPLAFAKQYAPPEVAYGVIPEKSVDRTRGVDVYHLGCLTTYLLAGVTPTVHYVQGLKTEMIPTWWGGAGKIPYDTALPFLVNIHAAFVAAVAESIPEEYRPELTKIIMELTHPDYARRGDPDHRARVGHPHGVDAYMNKFERLSRKSFVKLSKQS